MAQMLERILNAALEGEMDAHLSDESRESGNRRNGKMSKTVQTQYGEVTVDTPRDRDGSFAPQTVRKRETILAEDMADQIIGMYAFGMSMRDISRYFEREFNTRLSAETISAITDRVLPEVREWKTRSLDAVYAICWLDVDAIHYKVRDESSRAVTRAVGVGKDGHKELLGMYVARWGEQYPIVIRSWRENWERLTEFFLYTKEIQRIIYTTNTVEGYHRQIRKVTKNKGAIRHGTGEACLSGLPQRQPEVDDADGQLGACLTTTGYKIWK